MCHLDKPLSDYILSGSHVRTGQQDSSFDNANITVVDNTSASGSVAGDHVSDNESVSVSPGGLTGLSDTPYLWLLRVILFLLKLLVLQFLLATSQSE